MSVRKIIETNTYRNYPINSKHGGCYDSWLDNLIDLSEYAASKFTRPRGYIISFQLSPSATIKNILDNLKYFFLESDRARETTPTKPLYVWKCEEKILEKGSKEYAEALNPEAPYRHYHMAVIVEGKYRTPKSITKFFQQQQENGLTHHYSVSEDDGRHSGEQRMDKCLKTKMDDWIYHASYLCKLDTAVAGKSFNACRFKEASNKLKIKKTKQAENRLANGIDCIDIAVNPEIFAKPPASAGLHTF